ncbi:MAG: hypothetical protein LBE35_02800 [Clostridiales bacterium]|jgi:sporulation integral membrane protein YlbJ|nr:hypothetical protein [Clostridiales bacterium]
MKHKTIALIALIAGLNLLILIYPEVALEAASRGLNLWFNSFLPGILPFVVGANMLMALGATRLLGRFLSPVMRAAFRLPGQAGFPLVMGIISGYPLGAKIVCEMRAGGEIDRNDAQRLLGFSNNAGPLFILGAVGVGMFGSASFGYLLMAAHYTAALAFGLALRIFAKARHSRESGNPPLLETAPFSQILGTAVKNAMETAVLVGGFIVLFSVLSALLNHFGLFGATGARPAIFAGIFEMTGGLGQLGDFGLSRSIAALSAAILSFGGLSILFQALSFIAKTDLNPSLYVLSKIAHGALAAIAAYIFYPVFF